MKTSVDLDESLAKKTDPKTQFFDPPDILNMDQPTNAKQNF